MFIIPQIGKVIRQAALLTKVAATAIVFLIFLIFTFISWQNSKHTLELRKEQKINDLSSQIQDGLENRIRTNVTLARAGAGLFNSSEMVTRDEWERFFDTFNVPERFSDVSTVGYAQDVSGHSLDEFEKHVRETDMKHFKVTPEGKRDHYVPVLYQQRYMAARGSIGFDQYSEPKRREALDIARDTGEPAMTDLVKFRSSPNTGILLYMPVYRQGDPVRTVQQRRDAIKGFSYTSVLSKQLLDNIVPKNLQGVGVTIEDSNQGRKKVLSSTLDAADTKRLTKIRTTDFKLYGQTWEIDLYADGSIVSSTENQRPLLVLLGGLMVSCFAAAAVYMVIQYRTRAFAMEEERRLQQAKNELLSLASHQLRTPATGVKQYVGMVLEGFGGEVSKEQVDLLEHAYQSNERQLQIINEFLYLAKLGSGSLKTTVHKFDLAALTRDVIEEMVNEIHDKEHTLHTDIPKKVIVQADEHSVRMIVENLLSNAIKYTKRGGTIRLSVKRSATDIRVIVEDNGIGIARQDMKLLFKQFSRVPNDMASEVNGSGIGLYLAQQLARHNGGRVIARSKLHQGSTFTLHLPKKSVRKLTNYRNRK